MNETSEELLIDSRGIYVYNLFIIKYFSVLLCSVYCRDRPQMSQHDIG